MTISVKRPKSIEPVVTKRRLKTPFKIGDRVVRNKAVGGPIVRGDVPGTILKVTATPHASGGSRARLRVLWDNGHEASVEDRQLARLATPAHVSSSTVATSFVIHTMGGPIRRVFSSVEIAKQWATEEWTFPKTIAGLVATKRLSPPRAPREAADVQRRLGDENAEHFERHKSGVLVIEAGEEEDVSFTFGIRYKGKDERVWATICERQHCGCCGHVVATRSDLSRAWEPSAKDDDYWSKDLALLRTRPSDTRADRVDCYTR